MTSRILTRRQMLVRGTSALGSLLLAGCDRLSNSPSFRAMLESPEGLSYRAQRLLVGHNALAREFKRSDLSPVFRSNGTSHPDTPSYNALAIDDFRQWRLKIDGLVARPQEFSLDQLCAMPSRTQITRHDCVEGWSAIGKWTGVPLRALLDAVSLRGDARYVVFRCMDNDGS